MKLEEIQVVFRGWSGEGLKSTHSPIGGGVGGGAILSGGADWFDM